MVPGVAAALLLVMTDTALVTQPVEFVGPPTPRAAARPARPVSLRAALEVLLERKTPRLIEAERRRLTWGSGLVGLGAYRPTASDSAAWGYGAVPLQLFAQPGLGQSLSISPLTGKLR